MKFLLLRGLHAAKYGDLEVVHHPKDMVESSLDLCKLFNSPGSTRFQRAPSSAQVTVQGKPLDGSAVRAQVENLEQMTVAELREYAANNEVELGNATKKDEIVETIRAALA